MTLRLGIEVVASRPALAQAWGRCAVLCNAASLDRSFVPTWTILKSILGPRLRAFFGPQHGLFPTVQDNMIETPHRYEAALGARVYSLYSETREPTAEMLEDVDTLVVDIPIVGCRVYTFKATLAACLRAAKAFTKRVVVLDRPNPLGCETIEGPVLEESNRSFVGPDLLPMRHALTVGECARFMNRKIHADLSVIEMEGYTGRAFWPEILRHWIPTSPNLPTWDSVVVYPGMVLLEGTNLSEGRGTTLPFQMVGAPYIDDPEGFVSLILQSLGAGDSREWGFFLRPVRFQPTFHKWAHEECGGMQIHVVDPKRLHSFALAIATIKAAIAMGGARFMWKDPPYEYNHTTPPIQLLVGMNATLRLLQDPKIGPMDAIWSSGHESYRREVAPFRLYLRD